jgi:hypothetical protein
LGPELLALDAGQGPGARIPRMKPVIASALLGLALCLPALAQNEETIADLHTDCQSTNEVKRAYAMGFISGVAFMANYVSKGTLEKQSTWPATKGVLVDAVCRYISAHTSMWAEEATVGVVTAVNDLYLPKKSSGH